KKGNLPSLSSEMDSTRVSSFIAEALARKVREVDEPEANFLFIGGLKEPTLVLHFLSLMQAATLPA
ncbi:hypothetical protein Tco_0574826, partial [Tanacetum coccineum]